MCRACVGVSGTEVGSVCTDSFGVCNQALGHMQAKQSEDSSMRLLLNVPHIIPDIQIDPDELSVVCGK